LNGAKPKDYTSSLKALYSIGDGGSSFGQPSVGLVSRFLTTLDEYEFVNVVSRSGVRTETSFY
jgi:hypothetical protein